MADKLKMQIQEEFEILFETLKTEAKKFNGPTYTYINFGDKDNWKIIKFNKEDLTITASLTEEYYTKYRQLMESPTQTRSFKLLDLDTEKVKFKVEKHGMSIERKTIKISKKLKDLIAMYKKIGDKEESHIRLHSIGEDGRSVTPAEWREAAELADVERSKGESRAVTVNRETVCINASAAIETLDIFEDYRNSPEFMRRDPRKDGDLLYKACETNHRYRDVWVEYATREEIESQID